MGMKKIFITLSIFLIFFGVITSKKNYNQNLDLLKLDSYIKNWINESDIPGASIAIVKNGSVIFAKGYGYRKLGEMESVNKHTLFQTGSLTKPMTATLIGILVDEKRIEWDDPIIKHMPEFKLDDPYITKNLTIIDVLTVRSGIVGGDKLTGANRKEIIKKMRNLKPTGQFRITQGSFNLHYLLAGQVIAAIEQRVWDDVIKNRILIPLNMKETFTNISSAMSFKNVAVPHNVINKELKAIQWRNYENFGPAEGIVSNVVDMAKWVNFHLNEGVYEGKTIVSKKVINEMHSPHIIPDGWWKKFFNPHCIMMGMGLSWAISDYKGLKVLDHYGIVEGMTAFIGLIPEKRFGLVVLTNRHYANKPISSLKYKIYNEFLAN